MKYYAGIDVGGTKIYAVVITEEGKILSRAKVKTGVNPKFDSVLQKMLTCYQTACQKAKLEEADISAVGLAVPSSVDQTREVIKHAPNLGWIDLEFGKLFKDTFNKPLFVGNDGNMGVFAEYHLGAGKPYSRVYGLFVGTGLGGGYVTDGNIIRGVDNTAGEAGHIIIKMGGPPCNCGLNGCVEAIAPKVGMIKYMIKQVDEKGGTTLLDEIAPKWRENVGSSALRKAFQRGDKVVKKALKRSAKAIGVAAGNIITLTGVEAIVIGGGVVEELGDFFMPRIEKSMRKNTFANGAEGVALLQSTLGDDAVALGAAWFVRLPEKEAMLVM